MNNVKEKIKAVMIGHAVADALGVPVEFCERAELDENPITDMIGYGTYPYPKGTWSDDTSMSIAALDSLASGELNFDNIMINFGKWYYDNEYTPSGLAFDVGNTCSYAITNYFIDKKSKEECGLFSERSNGNGSLMRIHPFSLAVWYNVKLRPNWESVIDRASALTHAHERSKLACKIYTLILFFLLDTPSKDSVRVALSAAARRYAFSEEYECYSRIFSPDFESIPREEIQSSGYVVDTLEAAIWCLLTTDSYSECVLKAVNLGDDTDTVAAVAGGLAAALYGYESIPERWLSALFRRDYIEKMCVRAANAFML